MNDEEKKIVSDEIKGLYVGIGLWFLSDNIKYDEERMKRLFNGTIDRIKKQIENE